MHQWKEKFQASYPWSMMRVAKGLVQMELSEETEASLLDELKSMQGSREDETSVGRRRGLRNNQESVPDFRIRSRRKSRMFCLIFGGISSGRIERVTEAVFL
jgi:hypothetical protein